VAEALRAREIPFVLSSAHKNAELAAVSVLTDAPNVGKAGLGEPPDRSSDRGRRAVTMAESK
jgi:hypothetical protein